MSGNTTNHKRRKSYARCLRYVSYCRRTSGRIIFKWGVLSLLSVLTCCSPAVVYSPAVQFFFTCCSVFFHLLFSSPQLLLLFRSTHLLLLFNCCCREATPSGHLQLEQCSSVNTLRNLLRLVLHEATHVAFVVYTQLDCCVYTWVKSVCNTDTAQRMHEHLSVY